MTLRLHIDPLGGVAGDMWLGLLVDLGLDPQILAGLPARLGLDGIEVSTETVARGALRASKVHVRVRGWEEPPAEAGGPHHHDHHGAHRHLGQMLEIIDRAELPPRARALARDAFQRLYAAEAQVHGKPVEEIHLHEAGADDALIDVIGACLGIVELGIETVSCSTPLPVGGGFALCEHGRLPVPVPAVTALLEGVDVTGGPIPKELITPTGAALLRAIVTDFGPLPQMTLERTGYGAGTRDDPGLSNVLRGLLGPSGGGPVTGRVEVLTTALDDMLPQDIPVLIDRLVEAGALDAWTQSIGMKKGRPGVLLTVIARPPEGRALARAILEQSTSLGVRLSEEERLEWARDTISVPTPWGDVRIKRAIDDRGKILRGFPEFEDCREAARRGGVEVDRVRRAAQTIYDDQPEDDSR